MNRRLGGRPCRGVVLPLVLVVSVVLFLLAGAVGTMSLSQAKMAVLHHEQVQAREQAYAGLAEAKAWLDRSTDWTSGTSSFSAWTNREIQADPTVPAYYIIKVESSTRDTAVVVATGYLKDDNGAPRRTVSERAVFERSDMAFRYPLQTVAFVRLTSSQVSTRGDDVAVRTNTNDFILVTSQVHGDVMTGVSPDGSLTGAITLPGAIDGVQAAAAVIAHLFGVQAPPGAQAPPP